MTDGTPYRGNGPTVGISGATRARLHKRLDELLDLQDQIDRHVAETGMSDELADRLQHHAEKLVIRASRFAGEVAGGDARAIAFRHPEPTSRLALARFLKLVAEFAAPYAYATLNLGIDTFTWTDVMAVLDDISSLEHGDLPIRMMPAKKAKRGGAKHGELRDWWRATLWVEYHDGLILYQKGRRKRSSSVSEVAQAYGISVRRLYDWMKDSRTIKDEFVLSAELEEARRNGEMAAKPFFTLSPYGSEDTETYSDWLKHDAAQYNSQRIP